MASQTLPYITPEDYLKAERQSEFKSEYYAGQVYAMAGATPRHTRIATNFVIKLGSALAGGPCQVFNSDMRSHLPATGLYTYPDVSVVCGEPVFVQSDNLTNPIVVVEVRTTKFLDYQSVPSLKEYLLVSQYSRSITLCTRLTGNEWRIETVGSEQGSIIVSSLGVELTFDEIYAGADSLPA